MSFKRAVTLLNSGSRRLIVQSPILNGNKILVNEYPKSGGTWLANLISDYLEIPFPRNTFPSLKRSMIHGHFLTSYSTSRNSVVLWRDGRDVMVSWYYHSLFKNDIGNHTLVDIVARDLNFKNKSDIKNNLAQFIEYSYQRQTKPNFTWSDFVRKWANDSELIHTNYESLKSDTTSELTKVLTDLTSEPVSKTKVEKIVEKHRFVGGQNKNVAAQHSFQRKGIVGDWRNCFDSKSVEVFKHFAGQELEILGYEKDNDWNL